MNNIENKKNGAGFIYWLDEITKADVSLVGGKNANLGEMYKELSSIEVSDEKIHIPFGFAISTYAYSYFIEQNNLKPKIAKILEGLDEKDLKKLESASLQVRKIITDSSIPQDLEKEILEAQNKLAQKFETAIENMGLAVRSSSTDEDSSKASFAGQQESYLNVRGQNNFLEAVKKVFASLFNVRAILYRQDNNLSSLDAVISVGVQKMVRSDIGTSGIMFTMDTENGFDNLVLINASYGLGEVVTKGEVTPDEYKVLKSMLKKGVAAVLEKRIGSKEKKLVYSEDGSSTKQLPVSSEDRHVFALHDGQITKLAKWAVIIEEHFGCPMDIEWAYDGEQDLFYIVQARPETAEEKQKNSANHEYVLLETGDVILKGMAVGKKVGAGKVHHIKTLEQISEFKAGEVLVTENADAEWEPLIKIAAAVITDKGGRASHAAIIAREFGIPAVIGTAEATKVLKDGQEVTVSCVQGQDGKVYKGILKFKMKDGE